jgi:hypothetical protein
MSAKILAFDPNRRIPPRHYTPIAMRGRLLSMPSRAAKIETSELTSGGDLSRCAVTSIQGNRLQGCGQSAVPAAEMRPALSQSASLRW